MIKQPPEAGQVYRYMHVEQCSEVRPALRFSDKVNKSLQSITPSSC